MSFERSSARTSARKERPLPPRIPLPPRESTRPLRSGVRIPAPGPEFAPDPRRDALIKRLGEAEARKPISPPKRPFRVPSPPIDLDFRYGESSLGKELEAKQNRELYQDVSKLGGKTWEDRHELRKAFATSPAEKAWLATSEENRRGSERRDTLIDGLTTAYRSPQQDQDRSIEPRETAAYQLSALDAVISELDDVVKGPDRVRKAIGASDVFQSPRIDNASNRDTIPTTPDQPALAQKVNLFPEGRDRPFDLPRHRQLGALEQAYQTEQKKYQNAQALINFFDGLMEQKHAVNPESLGLLDRLKLGATNVYHALFKHQDARAASQFFQGYIQNRLADTGYSDPTPLNRAIAQASPAVLEQARLQAVDAFELATEEAARLKEQIDTLKDEIHLSERTTEEAQRDLDQAKFKRIAHAQMRNGQVADHEFYGDKDYGLEDTEDDPLNQARMERMLVKAGWNPEDARREAAEAISLEEHRRRNRPQRGNLSDLRKAIKDSSDALRNDLRTKRYSLNGETERRGPIFEDFTLKDVPTKVQPFFLDDSEMTLDDLPVAADASLENSFDHAVVLGIESLVNKYVPGYKRQERALELLADHLADYEEVRISGRNDVEMQNLLALRNPSEIDFALLTDKVSKLMDTSPGMALVAGQDRHDLATALAAALHSETALQRRSRGSRRTNTALAS